MLLTAAAFLLVLSQPVGSSGCGTAIKTIIPGDESSLLRLSGKVKTLYAYSHEYNYGKLEQHGFLRMVAHFDTCGRLTSITSWSRKDSLPHATAFQYDSKGGIVEELVVMESSAFRDSIKSNYFYNDDGYLREKVTRGKGDEPISSERYAYDNQGRLIREISFNETGVKGGFSYSYDFEGLEVQRIQTNERNDTVAILRNTYDSMKRLVKKEINSRSGLSEVTLFKYLFKYLSDGEVVEITKLSKDSSILESANVRYRPNHTLLEKIVHSKSRGQKTLIRYDNFGNPREEIIYVMDELSFADKYLYEYYPALK